MTILDATSYGLGAGNTAAANQTALAAWWMALSTATAGTQGYIPAGTYNIAGNNIWDYAGTRAYNGITIYGDGQHQTILNFTTTTGTALQIEASGGSNPATLVPYYYNVIRDMAFQGHTTGMAFKIGQDNGGDSIQASEFRNLWFANGDSGSGGALRINGATQCVFSNIVADAYPATASNAGSGSGCELTMAAFNTFVACSFSNGNVGLLITNLGNAGIGFVYSNTFLNLDIENTKYCVKQTSGAASRNIFITGEWYTIYPGGYGVSCSAAGNSFPGAALILEDVNLPLNPLYGTGGTSPALDPNNQLAVIFKGGCYGTVSTPAGGTPVSGTTYTNTTGQAQYVTWGGTLSAVEVNGLGLRTTVNSAYLAPGDTIKLTGTSLAWYWRNVIN